MDFKNVQVFNFEGAIRGMRNPMNSWDKSDSKEERGTFIIGPNDLGLMQRLINGGSEHRKFMRQIFVSVDITAPLYFWSEFDTYKVGTCANSTSKMHKLATTPITIDCFETDDYQDDLQWHNQDDYLIEYDSSNSINAFVDMLENLRLKYLETKDKRYWKELIRWLPESWLQTRTVTLSYENLFSMIRQRKNHKLNEWSGKDNPLNKNFIAFAKTLPYAKELLFFGLEEESFDKT